MAFVFIAFVLAILYYVAPDVQQTWHWISPGSLLASLLWLSAIVGFKFYLSISNPASGYGAAGSVVVLMFFLWVSSLVFIVGAEINAIFEKRYDRKTIRDLISHPEKSTAEVYRDEERRAQHLGLSNGSPDANESERNQ